MKRRLTAIIEREGNAYVALCPELDIASQGDSIEGARDNLQEAPELFLRLRRWRRSTSVSVGKYI
jgi:predicted RNase H-like HicB family nuclease